jgi:hypothetical protein
VVYKIEVPTHHPAHSKYHTLTQKNTPRDDLNLKGP